jgi:outer membrane protein OmpA-like peptidoglycan-associated protein
MLAYRTVKPRAKDEAEKPFWISFSDLMTALMVLFLLVMSVALLAVTKTVSEAERAAAERKKNIEELLGKVEAAAKQERFHGITVDRSRNVIDFGDRARFDTGRHQLTPAQASLLREFVPEVLKVARDPLGEKWLKRIVVEGFADQRGTYLMNLNLSLQRSQRVLCVLLARSKTGPDALSTGEMNQVRDLFLVGGYSFNSAKASLEESRRIELRLEFLNVGESRPKKPDVKNNDFGPCAIGE